MKILNLIGTLGIIASPSTPVTHEVSKINTHTQNIEIQNSLNTSGYQEDINGLKELFSDLQRNNLFTNINMQQVEKFAIHNPEIVKTFLHEVVINIQNSKERMWHAADYITMFTEFFNALQQFM